MGEVVNMSEAAQAKAAARYERGKVKLASYLRKNLGTHALAVTPILAGLTAPTLVFGPADHPKSLAAARLFCMTVTAQVAQTARTQEDLWSSWNGKFITLDALLDERGRSWVLALPGGEEGDAGRMVSALLKNGRFMHGLHDIRLTGDWPLADGSAPVPPPEIAAIIAKGPAGSTEAERDRVSAYIDRHWSDPVPWT